MAPGLHLFKNRSILIVSDGNAPGCLSDSVLCLDFIRIGAFEEVRE